MSYPKKFAGVVPFCLTSLPEDLLVRISSYVAASDYYEDSINLMIVSKVFYRISTDPHVLRSLSENAIRRLLWTDESSEHRKKFEKAVHCGNLEALFYKGKWDLFIENKRSSGMEFLMKAANEGHEKSIYLYGMILISLGGENKPKGYNLLSSLLQKRVSDSESRVEILRKKIVPMFWANDPVLKEFKQSYVRDVCLCNGKTLQFLEGCGWRRNGWELLTSDSCQICFWNQEVEEFYKNY